MSIGGPGRRKQGPETTNWEEHSAVADLSTGRRFKAVQQVPMVALEATDSVDSNISYYGFSKASINATLPYWRIMREGYETDGATTYTAVRFADGNDSFDNIWLDREILEYS